ncbi:MAG: general secretion pathway protein GspK [Phycisphaerae bacterium]|nr:general secretion pathway protein GspK [Phycisphaerae bacterium]
MTNAPFTSCFARQTGGSRRSGLALILTVVVLVVLSTVCYTLTARISMLKRRQEYMINYQKSRYACDSAVKLALSTVQRIPLNLIIRKGEPDFSDLFTMDHEEYELFLAEWAERKAAEMAEETAADGGLSATADELLSGLLGSAADPNSDDPNGSDVYDSFNPEATGLDPGTITIPGPYGSDWPLVHAAIEFDIGDSRVVIRIEDENAKMPLIWAMTTNASQNREAEAAFETFCEWMQMYPTEVDDLKKQVSALSKYKTFALELKPVVYTEQTEVVNRATPTSRTAQPARTAISRTTTRTVLKTRPAIAHTTDFAKLLHSSVLDTDRLAWALPNTGSRYEAPLKYLALWGSQRVNINTAPRHVLEAAFTFGGDAREIAQEIILMRQDKPFKDINELKSKLYRYSDSIRKVEPYITTRSTFFSVKVTATTGSARASTVATVVREGTNVQRIALLAF